MTKKRMEMMIAQYESDCALIEETACPVERENELYEAFMKLPREVRQEVEKRALAVA